MNGLFYGEWYWWLLGGVFGESDLCHWREWWARCLGSFCGWAAFEEGEHAGTKYGRWECGAYEGRYRVERKGGEACLWGVCGLKRYECIMDSSTGMVLSNCYYAYVNDHLVAHHGKVENIFILRELTGL